MPNMGSSERILRQGAASSGVRQRVAVKALVRAAGRLVGARALEIVVEAVRVRRLRNKRAAKAELAWRGGSERKMHVVQHSGDDLLVRLRCGIGLKPVANVRTSAGGGGSGGALGQFMPPWVVLVQKMQRCGRQSLEEREHVPCDRVRN